METLLSHKENLHHFYIIEGDKENILPPLFDFFENKLKFQTHANPLFHNFSWDKLLIDSVREIISKYTNKIKEGEKKIFIISFNSITEEAQNALLKALEEPNKGTHFFLVVPDSKIFLSTVVSRAIIIKDKNNYEKFEEILSDLCDKNIGEKIAWVSEISEKIKDGKLEKEFAKKFVETVIYEMRKKIKSNNIETREIKNLLEIHQYLKLSGASIKILLEKVVLML